MASKSPSPESPHCTGFIVSVETSTTYHYLCADRPTDTILHIKQELQEKTGILDRNMILIDKNKNEKIWQNHELITANLDLKLMNLPRPYAETQLDIVTDLLAGSKVGQEYQTEMLDFYLPKLYELSRTQQEEIIKISSENMEKEWNSSFEPVVNRLKKDLKRRVQQLVTDKVMLEQEIQRQQSGACAEFDFEKEWEKFLTIIDPTNYQPRRTSFESLTQTVKSQILKIISKLQKREQLLTFFILYRMTQSVNSYPSYFFRIYIITLSSIYKIDFNYSQSGMPDYSMYPVNITLLYKFDIKLSPDLCKIFKNYSSKTDLDVRPQQGFSYSGRGDFGMDSERFYSLFTSIPGTLYPDAPGWRWLDTPDDDPQRYIHYQTGEITDQLPYDTPPVKYE